MKDFYGDWIVVRRSTGAVAFEINKLYALELIDLNKAHVMPAADWYAAVAYSRELLTPGPTGVDAFAYTIAGMRK